MRKSIVTKYFLLCSAVVLFSIICIGSVLLLVSSEFYKSQEKEALLAGMNEVITATKLSYLSEETGAAPANMLNIQSLTESYKTYTASTGADYTLVDSDGELVVCTEEQPCIHAEQEIPEKTLELINKESNYFSEGTLDGFYNEQHYNTAATFVLGMERFSVFAKSSTAPLDGFLLRLVIVFITVGLVIMACALTVMYFLTRKLTAPIKEMTAAAERFGRGDFSEKLHIVEDDEIGILADTMNEMAYSLSVLEDTRKSFIANVSHELKTPMTTIGGFVDGILDGTIPKEQQRRYLKIVSEEVSRLARLVRSMLNIAKYETGEVKMEVTDFNITELTIKTVLLFENRLEQKELDIRGLNSPPFFVKADTDLTQQVIYNLVENAVKFVNQGGYISFAFEQKEGEVFLSIRNSGEGLEEGDLPKVFDRFYKTDESHGKDKTGVGLGLSIVRSILKLHNGKIWVTSTKDEFTEFSFSLPLGSDSAERNARQGQLT